MSATGLFFKMFCRDIHSALMSLVSYKNTCLTEGEVWQKVFFKKNSIIVMLSTQILPSSFLSRSVA